MGFIHRIRTLFHSDKLTAEIEEELRYHLASREELNAREGMSPADARQSARRSFGNLTRLKESTRDTNLPVLLETVLQDLHFAARMLAKHPGFTALAVLALSVGIGVNTAVFTACKAVLLQPLDAKNPEQLVNVYHSEHHNREAPSFSYPDFEFYRDHIHSFSRLVATTGAEMTLTDGRGANAGRSMGGGLAQAFGFRLPSILGGRSQFVSVAAVSGNYFAMLGVDAIRGRVFLPQDAQDLQAHPAILISENFWQRRFDGDPAVLGSSVKLNGVPFTIIGITAHDFMGTMINVPNIWLPIELGPLASSNLDILRNREATCCALYGRLAPNTSLGQSQAEMTLLANRVRALHAPNSDGSRIDTIDLTPGSHIGPGQAHKDPGLVFALLLILGAVGLVLLIACANVANLQLARSAARQKEIGVRLSVGASRLRIVRQLLTESALLGLIAGVVSLLMTWGALRVLMVQIAANVPIEWGSVALHVEPDAWVFGFVFLVSLFASVLFGLAPALQASRPSLSSALKEEGSGLALHISNSRLGGLLIGTQAAACLFLLVGAGLLIHGSIHSMIQNPGYETKHAISLELSFPPGFGYNHAMQVAEVNQLLNRLGGIPWIKTVAQGVSPDGGGLRMAAVGINGAKPATGSMARTVFYQYVTPSFFDCLSIPVILGHTSTTRSEAEASMLVSQSAAAEFWPGENPIGKKLSLDASDQFHDSVQLFPQGLVYQVIGVVGDTRAITPQGDEVRKVYLPLTADRFDGGLPLLIRFTGDPKVALREIAKQLQAVDPNLIVYASTLEDQLTSTPRFVITQLSAIFASLVGLLGLVLACVGIYGTVSYAVVRRTREVGIRMALGARKMDVLRMIVFESARPVMLGLIVGAFAAAGAARLLRSLLFGIGALDPVSFLGVGILFLAISLFAAYLPARRATHVDPLVALRCD